jgi:hypothetical protein
MVGFNVLATWECAGRTGYGEIQDFFELPQLNGLNALNVQLSGPNAAAS